MGPRRRLLPLLGLGLGLVLARAATAQEIGRHRFDPGAKVRAARAIDVDGDGKRDVVLLLEPREGKTWQVLLLRTPATPDPKSFWTDAAATRIACDGELAEAGAVACGRFGPQGAFRLRFLGARGIVEVDATGARAAADPRLAVPTLFARSPGRPLALWEGVGDVDRDGLDELWFPHAADGGRMHLLGGRPEQDRRIASRVGHVASTGLEEALKRTTYVPTLVVADMDGDKRHELIELRDGALHVYDPAAPSGEGGLSPAQRIPLSFLAAPADLPPEEVRTPRLNVADADGDGLADLLITLVSGRRDKIGGLRTTLWFVPGPLVDPATGRLRTPDGRVDTESVALHPRFVDLDGDGALDYVGDSIRGSTADLIKNMMGKDPTITLVGFRFDKATRRFASEPFFSVGRVYPSEQALSNKFGVSALFDGDFDGDGRKDLLDLGNLTGVEIVGSSERPAGAAGDAFRLERPLLPRLAVPKPLAAAALVADLTGDERDEAVLWNDGEVYVLAPRGPR
jgi:hypothetical protein